MAAPNFEQIQSFDRVNKQLIDAAKSELQEYLYDGITREEVIEIAVELSMKYSLLGAELGAQWYDLCSELAGLDVDPAEISDVDGDSIRSRANSFADKYETSKPIETAFNSFLQNEINNSIRKTGNANLWRDYERGMTGGRWCRVPVGETCAWCLMLASQGAWYISEKSALGPDPGHYHDDCNCKAVYHADAESIQGYTQLEQYKGMYYDCENTRMAANSGREPYPEELQQRINAARLEHEAKYENGDTDKSWTVYNEDLIIMRYKYGVT